MKIKIDGVNALPDNVALVIDSDGMAIMSYSINITKEMSLWINTSNCSVRRVKNCDYLIAVFRARIITINTSNILGCYHMLKEMAMIEVRETSIRLKQNEINNIKLNTKNGQLLLW